MTQTIELSNGDKLEFPDEMTDDQIHGAIQKEYGSQKNNLQENKPTSKDNQCVFYERDRNLKDTKPKIYEDIKSWMNKPIIEWYYLWNGKEWETYKSEYQY